MMGTLQLSPNDTPDQNMVNTEGYVAKNGTFVTSVVSIRNNANYADKTHLYWTTVIEQGSGLMARNHSCNTTTPDPTAPGSWTHTYSNNISQGLTVRRAPQT